MPNYFFARSVAQSFAFIRTDPLWSPLCMRKVWMTASVIDIQCDLYSILALNSAYELFGKGKM